MPTDPLLRINNSLTIPYSELKWRFSRAGGPGGQNVNRTASRVELLFDVTGSQALTEEQRELVCRRLRGYIGKDGVLHLVSSATPSQWQNREELIERFVALVSNGLVPVRKRIKTKPSRSSKEIRLDRKKRRSATKQGRGRVKIKDW